MVFPEQWMNMANNGEYFPGGVAAIDKTSLFVY